MERALQWILVVAVCASPTIIHAAGIDEPPKRNLVNVDYSGIYFLCFLSTILRINKTYKN